MSGGFPILGSLSNGQNLGADTSSSTGVTVTSSGSANTKGSYSQLVASTSSDLAFLLVYIFTASGSVTVGGLIDIAVGAAGSETVIIANLIAVSQSNDAVAPAFYGFPVSIPAGSRIAARSQDSTGGLGWRCLAVGFDGGFCQSSGSGLIDSIGASTTTSYGTALVPGAANVKGSYAQLTASTAADYSGFSFAIDDQGGTPAGVHYLVDIAVGAGGSETIIVPNFPSVVFPAAKIPAASTGTPFFPIQIPSGTRIAARCQASSGGNIGISLYGVR